MFDQFQPRTRPRRPLIASIAVHCVLLFLALRGPKPAFLAPSFLLKGINGARVTLIYAPNSPGTGELPSASKSKVVAQVPTRSHIQWTSDRSQAPKAPRTIARVDAESETAAQNSSGQAPSAGSPYGSLVGSAFSGHEVRPALPLFTFDPVVGASELGSLEGNVVVEITIDERGNIVQKTVIQSLAPQVDAKILAALESWRFRPATRDGVPVPSKQDVYYHFPIQR